jgi:hypothetical protein
MPRWPTFVDQWRRVVHLYAAWHSIVALDDLVNLWVGIVNGFLGCEGFDERVDPVFRAWLYGNLCRFVMLQRQHVKPPPPQYNPEQPGF